jgi:hypothetical protein
MAWPHLCQKMNIKIKHIRDLIPKIFPTTTQQLSYQVIITFKSLCLQQQTYGFSIIKKNIFFSLNNKKNTD